MVHLLTKPHPYAANDPAAMLPPRKPKPVSPKTLKAIALLLRHNHPPVKLLADRKLLIPPARAIQLLRQDEHDICWNFSGRVKWIRLLKPPAKWEACWLNTKAAVLQPGLEWGT